MIRSRIEILSQNQTLAEAIIRHQILRKQFEQDSFIEKEGVGLNTLVKVVAKSIMRLETLRDKPLRFVAGDDEYPFDEPANLPVIKEEIFSPKQDHWELKEKDNLLLLKEMQDVLGSKHLLVISDYVVPWLDRRNDDEDVQKAIDFLQKEVDNRFNGGYELSGDDIITYLPHLSVLSLQLTMAFENSGTGPDRFQIS